MRFSAFFIFLSVLILGEVRADSDSEYSFQWLDPDKKIYVLQNRRFLKTNRLLVSAMGGVGFSNAYRSSYNFDPRLSYYFSESFGLDVFYTLTSNSPNNIYKALSTFSQYPTVRQIQAQYGAMIQYLPWYAKINVFNAILHFDWYFGAGAGQVATEVDTNTVRGSSAHYVQQNLLGLFLSTGQLFHVTDHLDVRLEVTGSYYQAAVSGLSGETAWFSNYNFGTGLGWRF